jgi:hypothetical protein
MPAVPGTKMLVVDQRYGNTRLGAGVFFTARDENSKLESVRN